jgi:hypothetical protein
VACLGNWGVKKRQLWCRTPVKAKDRERRERGAVKAERGRGGTDTPGVEVLLLADHVSLALRLIRSGPLPVQ